LGGAHRDPAAATATLKAALIENLDALSGVSGTERVRRRAERFRRFGVFREASS
jgi:acetyl-CoA carboxylase carboxyl transferase subunit alpha